MDNDLPIHAHGLIRVAIEDLEEVEKDARYAVSMGDWHTPRAGVCQVCLAGSVMAKSLHVPHFRDIWSPDMEKGGVPTLLWDYTTAMKLKALDSFRRGDVTGGLYELIRAQETNTKQSEIDLLILNRMYDYLTGDESVSWYEYLGSVSWQHETPYSCWRDEFKEDMREMADKLEKLYDQVRKELTNGN